MCTEGLMYMFCRRGQFCMHSRCVRARPLWKPCVPPTLNVTVAQTPLRMPGGRIDGLRISVTSITLRVERRRFALVASPLVASCYSVPESSLQSRGRGRCPVWKGSFSLFLYLLNVKVRVFLLMW